VEGTNKAHENGEAMGFVGVRLTDMLGAGFKNMAFALDVSSRATDSCDCHSACAAADHKVVDGGIDFSQASYLVRQDSSGSGNGRRGSLLRE